MKLIDVVIGMVLREGRFLICQRREDAALGGYWEFPGGKREPGESAEQCLVRELDEELSIQIRPIEAFAPIEFDYALGSIRLHPYLCEHLSGQAQPLAAQQIKWVLPMELSNYRFPPANDELIRQLQQRFGAG
jgi:mutator protein MutT